MVLDALQLLSQGVMRSACRSAAGAAINLVGFNVLGLPLAMVLAFVAHLGVSGLWLGTICGHAFINVCFALVLWSTRWHDVCSASLSATSQCETVAASMVLPLDWPARVSMTGRASIPNMLLGDSGARHEVYRATLPVHLSGSSEAESSSLVSYRSHSMDTNNRGSHSSCSECESDPRGDGGAAAASGAGGGGAGSGGGGGHSSAAAAAAAAAAVMTAAPPRHADRAVVTTAPLDECGDGEVVQFCVDDSDGDHQDSRPALVQPSGRSSPLSLWLQQGAPAHLDDVPRQFHRPTGPPTRDVACDEQPAPHAAWGAAAAVVAVVTPAHVPDTSRDSVVEACGLEDAGCGVGVDVCVSVDDVRHFGRHADVDHKPTTARSLTASLDHGDCVVHPFGLSLYSSAM
jgi:hypothetical protein